MGNSFLPARVQIGWPGAQERPLRLRNDPRTGTVTTRTWHGVFTDVVNLLAPLQAAGYSTNLEPIGNGIYYELTAEIGYSWLGSGIQDNPVPVWERLSNKIDQDILQADLPIVNGCSYEELQILQSQMDNPPSAAQLQVAGYAASIGLVSQDSINLLGLILSGVKSTTIFQPIIRNTITVSNVYQIAASEAYVGSIFSNNTMLNGNVAANIPPVIPPTLIFSIPAVVYGGSLQLQYGWLKDSPNYTLAAYNKTQIIQDYQFGLWSQLLYTIY